MNMAAKVKRQVGGADVNSKDSTIVGEQQEEERALALRSWLNKSVDKLRGAIVRGGSMYRPRGLTIDICVVIPSKDSCCCKEDEAAGLKQG